MSRRIKILKVAPEFVVQMCIHGGGPIIKNALPADAEIRHRAIDGRGDLVLTIESATFPEVTMLGQIPIFPAPKFVAGP